MNARKAKQQRRERNRTAEIQRANAATGPVVPEGKPLPERTTGTARRILSRATRRALGDLPVARTLDPVPTGDGNAVAVQETNDPRLTSDRRNAYYCPACRGLTLTVHADPGVTPMFLACRRGGLEPQDNPCKGTAASLMYPPEAGFWNHLDLAHSPAPDPARPFAVEFTEGIAGDWEWFAADDEQRALRASLSLRRRVQS